jgi:hypothetical protein
MRKAVLVGGLASLGALLVAAGPGNPLAFGRIRAGEWQLRALDGSASVRRICLTDSAELIQLRHPGMPCSRFVVTNEASLAAVHYTCTGAGYGRTTIRVETPELIRIESQGLASQAPFLLEVEGRRVGSCGSEEPRR